MEHSNEEEIRIQTNPRTNILRCLRIALQTVNSSQNPNFSQTKM